MHPDPSRVPPPRSTWIELAQRARGGILIHLSLWLVVGGLDGLYRTEALVFWSPAAVFAALMAARVVFERRLAVRAAAEPRARLALRLLMLANPLCWGILAAAAFLSPTLRTVQMPILFIVTGVAASGGMGLAIDQVVRLGFPLCAMGPAALAMLVSPGWLNRYLACTALIFIVYVVRASKVVHDDYHAAVAARVELEARTRELERLSNTDALTGLFNRPYLDRQLAVEWSRAQRDGRSLSLLMVDIDHFKRLNDAHGHPFGDACLIAIAQALRDALHRPGDLVARYGGEEFAVLLPSIDAEGAMEVAWRMREAVAAVQLEHDGRRVAVACSIGVHSVDELARSSVGQLMASADRALYAAKRQGRDRVVASSAAPARTRPAALAASELAVIEIGLARVDA